MIKDKEWLYRHLTELVSISMFQMVVRGSGMDLGPKEQGMLPALARAQYVNDSMFSAHVKKTVAITMDAVEQYQAEERRQLLKSGIILDEGTPKRLISETRYRELLDKEELADDV